MKVPKEFTFEYYSKLSLAEQQKILHLAKAHLAALNKLSAAEGDGDADGGDDGEFTPLMREYVMYYTAANKLKRAFDEYGLQMPEPDLTKDPSCYLDTLALLLWEFEERQRRKKGWPPTDPDGGAPSYDDGPDPDEEEEEEEDYER